MKVNIANNGIENFRKSIKNSTTITARPRNNKFLAENSMILNY